MMNKFQLLLASLVMIALGAFSCITEDPISEEENAVQQALASGEISGSLTLPNVEDEAGKADYVLNNDLYITGNVEIAAGVVIEIAEGYGIDVVGKEASLRCNGTASQKVVFRGAQEQPGYWKGLRFRDAASTRNEFNHTEVLHGGGAPWGSDLPNANVVVEFYLNPSYLALNSCMLGQSEAAGLSVQYENSMLIENCDFVDNKGSAIIAPDNIVNDFSPTNSLSGNGRDAIIVTDAILENGEMRFNKLSNDEGYYLIERALDYHQGLVIEAGTQLRFESGTGLAVSGGNSFIECVGTESSPIVLTGTENVPGFWQGVEVYDCISAKNKMAYTNVSYGGASDLGPGKAANLTLDFYLSPASIDVQNCTFSHSKGYGIAIDGECTANGDNALVEAANNFTSNAGGNVYTYQ